MKVTAVSHALQISENMNVNTSVDGGTAFMRVSTAQGPKGIFDLINEAKNAMRALGNYLMWAMQNQMRV